MRWLVALALCGCDAVLRLQTVSDRHPDAAASGLLAYYPFEDTVTACAVDNGGGHHDGACEGGTVTPVAGPPGHGNAIALDGMTYIRVPHDAALDPTSGLTVASWVAVGVYPNDDYACFVNRPYFPAAAGANTWQVCSRPTDTLFLMSAQESFVYPGIPIGTWTHVAMTWEGTTAIGYLGGVEVTRFTAPALVYDAGDVWIGADIDATVNSYTVGSIDEIYVYNYALSPDEVAALAK